jgi:hypothetical protein
MSQESQAIEVEVVAIDGAAPVVKDPETAAGPPPWQNWRGRAVTFDGYWWPVWIILGAIALVLFMTVGLVFGAIYLTIRILRGLIRALIR